MSEELLNAEGAEDSQRTQSESIRNQILLCDLCVNFASSAFKRC